MEYSKIFHKALKISGLALALFLFGSIYFMSKSGIKKSTIQISSKSPPPQIQKVLAKQTVVTKASTPSATPTDKPAGFCLNVPVLFYHHIEPYAQAKTEGHASLTVDAGFFDRQMQYLVSHGYHTITAEDLAQALLHQKILPSKPIAVTIDDGYSDIPTYAFPVAQKYHVLLNLMIPTGLLNNPGYMSWDNLKNMVNSGVVFAYDHSWSHYSMPAGNDTKDQMEIMTAKTQLEQHLGGTVNIFTYPYGSTDNRIINLLRNDGFIAAFSTKGGFLQCDSFIYDLHRTRIGNASLSAYGL
ncbi:polysaccharide deacetylase family protein [Patescibacteria group bacterium]|nr:polysaccharide deacetylase family protein [Patescibacteria group bacterium]